MSNVDRDEMKKIDDIIARQYGVLRKCFEKKKVRIAVCFAIFFSLLVVNCALYFSEAGRSSDQFVVVIDPGHGGGDPGKVGTSDVLEKDVNLAISLKLKEALEKQGIKVVMTRENDESLATPGATNKKTSDMNNRVEIINTSQADILISIHQNSYTDASVKGAQVFYHGTSEESRTLAEAIQQNMISEVDPENKRVAKEGNDYFILRKSICPGVIIECGFLSCPEETARLIDEQYQQKLVDAISGAVCALYNENIRH